MTTITSAPVMLLGRSGMLGRALHAALRARGLTPVCPSSSELDLTDTRALMRAMPGAGATVINCAGVADAEAAERDPAAARALNALAPEALASVCAQRGARLVHVSTHEVFSGSIARAYSVGDEPDPINLLGQTKLEGELAITRSGCEHLIIRSSWLYAPWGSNPVRTVIEAGTPGCTLSVPDDRVARPSSAEHVAETTLKLIERGQQGIWHVTDAGQCTLAELARVSAALAHRRCRVQPCSTRKLRPIAERPVFGVLDITRTEELLGPMPVWQENLARVVGRLEHHAPDRRQAA